MKRNQPLKRAPALALLLVIALPAAAVAAEQITLDATLDTPVMLAGDEGAVERAFLRVALTGPELAETRRTPVNLAIVLDRSGSMRGAKLAEARRAAILAIERLRRDDIVSIVTYDSTVHVLMPATRLSDKEDIYRAIRRIQPGDKTALFAGVSKGARELRKFLDAQRVNRLILLSDGLANVGPSSPGELAELGASLASEGAAVTTIGLGLDYNEHLMTRLALASDGNHFFAETAADLERVYQAELGEVLSVVAQDVAVDVTFQGPVRPVRVLGRAADLDGQRLHGRLNQLYSRQTKYFLVEVEIPAGGPRQRRAVADVKISYSTMLRNEAGERTETRMRRESQSSQVAVRFTDSAAEIEAARSSRVMASVARQIGTERNRHAMRLRDQGKIEECRQALLDNAAYLEKSARLYGSRWLELDAKRNLEDAANLDPEAWQRQRKRMNYNQAESVQSLGYIE